MNNRQLAKQLFETKFIKALYQTNLDRSFLNQIIAQELLKESDTVVSALSKDLAALEDAEPTAVDNLIELFLLTAKFKVSYISKFTELAEKGEEGFSEKLLNNLNSYIAAVEKVADKIATGVSFKAFTDAVEQGSLNKEDIARALNAIGEERIKNIYEKLKPTAEKTIKDAISKIDKQQISGDITKKTGAISEIRKIVNKAKRSLARLENFPEEAKAELGDKFDEYGRLKAFIDNDLKNIIAKIKQFLDSFADRKDQIQSDIANLRTMSENVAVEIPESIKDLVEEWKQLETEISEVFDQMTDKDLYVKGSVDEEGKDSLPSVSMKEGSLAEMLAYALVYDDDEQVKKIYDSIESEGVGIFKSAGASLKKAFNEVDEREAEGPLAAKKRIKYQKSKKLFSKFEAEIGLAIATAVLEKEPKPDEEGSSRLSNFFDDEELKASERFKGVKLEFSKSELARNKTSIKILKQFMRNKRKLSGIAYQIEMKLRKGEWNSDVFKSLLDTVKPMGDLHKVSGGVFAKPLNKFLKQIYMVDGYDGFDVEARMQKDKEDAAQAEREEDFLQRNPYGEEGDYFDDPVASARATTEFPKVQKKSIEKSVKKFTDAEAEEKRKANARKAKERSDAAMKRDQRRRRKEFSRQRRLANPSPRAGDISRGFRPEDADDPFSMSENLKLEESIEKLIYLMLNEYKQKMEP